MKLTGEPLLEEERQKEGALSWHLCSFLVLHSFFVEIKTPSLETTESWIWVLKRMSQWYLMRSMLSVRNDRTSCFRRLSRKVSWKGTLCPEWRGRTPLLPATCAGSSSQPWLLGAGRCQRTAVVPRPWERAGPRAIVPAGGVVLLLVSQDGDKRLTVPTSWFREALHSHGDPVSRALLWRRGPLPKVHFLV